MPDIRDRFIRHVETPVAPTATGRPEDRVRETPNAGKRFYRPALPSGAEGLDGQLINAWTGVDAIADDLRAKVDAIWGSEPSAPVALTAQQKHAWRKAEVKRVVEAELEDRMKLVKPVVESARKELESRRTKLTAKGNVKLDGVPAQRALMIATHFSTLPAETRSLRIIEAMNSADAPASRELLEAIAWAPESLDLVAQDTLARVRATLVAASDPVEYSNLTALDMAIQATSESVDNLERWASGLAEEY